MKYKKFTGIILKKQNYREADQIVSAWTKEAGKMRCLGKSLRKNTSKLAYCMQELSEVQFEVTGNGLPTLIGAKPVRVFKSLHTDLAKAASGFYAAELMLKMTADEHANIQAYNLLSRFLAEMEAVELFDHYDLVDRFALGLAEALGFGEPKLVRSHSDVRKFIENVIERQIKSEMLLVSLN